MKIQLKDFRVAGYYPYNPIQQASMELGHELMNCTPWMKASVPGSIYHDLYEANLIDDPYFDTNSLAVEWVPERWWVYVTYFDKPNDDESYVLNIQGINYKAHIYVNHIKIGTTENMFVPQKFVISDLKDEHNELRIILEHAPDEFGQVGYTDQTFTQKSRFDYKWDFSVRMIDVGIWRPIFLESHKEIAIEDYYIRLVEDDQIALNVRVNRSSENHLMTVKIKDEDAVLYSESIPMYKETNDYATEFHIDDLKRWDIGHNDKPHLYQLEIVISQSDVMIEKLTEDVGFRKLRFVPNTGAPQNALPYTIELNDRRIYIKGVNLVPLDMMMGMVTEEHYERLILKLLEMNVNLVRIWGGGMIAPEEFYRLCDRHGILIWQDFIQSSSGINNYPSHLPVFLTNMSKTIEYTTKVKRNHPSLAAFCGGNELMDTDWRPVDLSVPNIRMIHSIIQKNCKEIMFFSSTPSGERFDAKTENQELNHDVHGEWRFLGNEKHYAFYNQTINLLHSEFGVNGMSSWHTIEKTMPKDLQTVSSYANDYRWRHRSDWWNTYEREKALFGEIHHLEDHVWLSQFIQAEGLRYVVDANRRMTPYQSGTIIWQINEPYPNGSCTSLIDYYGHPKMAYYAVSQSYNRIALSLKYDKLIYQPKEIMHLQAYCASEDETRIDYVINVMVDDMLYNTIEGSIDARENQSAKLTDIQIEIPVDAYTIHIAMISKTEDGRSYENHVLLLVDQTDKQTLQKKVIEYTKQFMREFN